MAKLYLADTSNIFSFVIFTEEKLKKSNAAFSNIQVAHGLQILP